MITITYFWLKSKIYFKKVIITANNTFAQFIVFINVISLTHQSYHNITYIYMMNLWGKLILLALLALKTCNLVTRSLWNNLLTNFTCSITLTTTFSRMPHVTFFTRTSIIKFFTLTPTFIIHHNFCFELHTFSFNLHLHSHDSCCLKVLLC